MFPGHSSIYRGGSVAGTGANLHSIAIGIVRPYGAHSCKKILVRTVSSPPKTSLSV